MFNIKYGPILRILSFFDLFDIYTQDLNLINKNIYESIHLKIMNSDPVLIKRIIEDWNRFISYITYEFSSEECDIYIDRFYESWFPLEVNHSIIDNIPDMYYKDHINISYFRDIIKNKNSSRKTILKIFYYIVQKNLRLISRNLKTLISDLLKDQRLDKQISQNILRNLKIK